jgi:hypothetical protein
MIAAGGVGGAVTALGLTYKINVIHLVNIIFLVSGLLGFARLKAGAHKEFQIYTGYLTGFSVMLLLFLLF